MKRLVIFSLIFVVLLYAEDKTQCIWTGVEKIVAVGDIHGDYNNFVEILEGVGIIDEMEHWIGGENHFVQTGDILDRGPDARKVFDLMMKLEKEAEQAGGKVHMLIGNHEEVNITGVAMSSVGYVRLTQFVSFLPDKYKEKKERKIIEKFEKMDSNDAETHIALDRELEIMWTNVMNNDSQAKEEYFKGFNETYGNWIIEHNTVIKINDIVFVHGGISEEFSTWKLKDINKLAREELRHYRLMRRRKLQPFMTRKILYQTQGPFWYRGLAYNDEKDFKEDVDRILHNLDAKYMVIAHTPQLEQRNILSRFDRRIWIIDTGISDVYGGNLIALVIENGKFISRGF